MLFKCRIYNICVLQKDYNSVTTYYKEVTKMKYITKKAIAIIVSLLAASGIFAGSPNSDTNQSTESQNTTVCQQTTSDYIAKETTASDGECNDCETEITTERAPKKDDP